MSRHVIVISEDALVYEDTKVLKQLPVFKSIWKQAARVKRVRSIYPSVTYPCHTTMMTGCYPDKHGIINNELSNVTELASDWNWFYDKVKVPSLFDLAKKNGLVTGAVFWPVTGNCPSVDYLINEYWPQKEGETTEECFALSGSSPEVIRSCIEPNVWMQKHRIHPYCDEFVSACAASMIRKYKPNLLMIHTANIDGYRHESGVFSPKVTHGLHEIDNWLGWIIKAAQDAGIYEDTDFFIVSDHGQININRVVCPNVLFARRGLIQVDEKGQVRDYTAMVKSSGASGQVFLKDSSDQKAYNKTYELLKEMCEEGIYGISRVYTAEEVKEEEHLAGDFSFVIETDGYTSFGGDWKGPLVRGFDTSDYRFGHATHGHHPDKGPSPTMIAFGPSIKSGVVMGRCSLADEAPTFAAALGLKMENTDGRVLKEIFKTE